MEWVTSTPSITQAFSTDADTTSGHPMVFKEYWDIISLQWVRVLITVVTMLAVLIALLGNGVVILVIYRRRSLRRNPTILFILNLALCDIISCLIYRPLLLLEVFLPFVPHFQEFVDHLDKCKVASYFKSLFAAVGFHTMVAISQERLLLIVYPLRAKIICTVSRTSKILVIIWMTAILLVLPTPIKYTEIIAVDIDGTIIKFCGYFSGAKLAIIYHALMFSFYFGIPLILLTVAYAKIFNALYRRQDGLDVNQESGGGKSMRIRKNLAKMMLSVSVIFAICWGPHFIYFLHLACGGKPPKNGFFTATVVEFLPIISSIMNPMLYTLNSRTFRTGFKNIIFGRRASDDTVSGARSFANVDSTHVANSRRHTLFGFSSFRLGGSKASKSITFVSGRRKKLQANGNGNVPPPISTGENSTDQSVLASGANGSTRSTFNNNNFELGQRRISESSPFVSDSVSEHEFSTGSREMRHCSSPELLDNLKEQTP